MPQFASDFKSNPLAIEITAISNRCDSSCDFYAHFNSFRVTRLRLCGFYCDLNRCDCILRSGHLRAVDISMSEVGGGGLHCSFGAALESFVVRKARFQLQIGDGCEPCEANACKTCQEKPLCQTKAHLHLSKQSGSRR